MQVHQYMIKYILKLVNYPETFVYYIHTELGKQFLISNIIKTYMS